jgi:hypothetical protein
MTMSAKDVERYRTQLKGERKKGSWWSLKPTESGAPATAYLRIGKPWKKDGEIWKDVMIHSGGFKEKVYCAHNDIDKDTGKPRKCAVCRRLKKLQTEDRTPFSKKLFGFLIPKAEALWNVAIAKVAVSSSGAVKVKGYVDRQFKILRLSKKWHLELVELFTEPEYRAEHVLGLADPKFGYLIRMKREGKELDTEYQFKVIGKPAPIYESKEKRIAINKSLANLDSLVKGSSAEELQAFVHAMEKKAKKLVAKEESREFNSDSDPDEYSEEDDIVEKAVKKQLRERKYMEDEDEE